MISLTRRRVESLTETFQDRRILVLGDLMLDEFIWGQVRRIAPEAPIPVVEITRETYLLGGAGNVAANIRALGGTPVPIGVIGQDIAANRIVQLMQERGIDASGLIRADRPTTVKTRIIAQNQQVVRADRESREPLSGGRTDALVEAYSKRLNSVHAVIVSDYEKGVVSASLMERVIEQARTAGIPVFLDPKTRHADCYRGVTLIKPNQREAELLAGITIETESDLEEAGRRILARFDSRYALISRGEAGMTLFGPEGTKHMPTLAREVYDVTGAGDTVISTVALAFAAGGAMEEAAILANHAAGLVVRKLGTATVSREELMADFDSHNAHSAG
jgi:rfaE bifunctional protein kinase chain/domain